MTALPWGDAWWASQTLAPITDAEPPAAPEPNSTACGVNF